MQTGSIQTAARTAAAQTAPSPRLVRAAHEFEAQMMSELIKPMMRDTSILGDEDESSDSGAGSSGALGEFAAESLGQALSNAGGFGIAHRIIGQLSGGHQNGTKRVTGTLH